MAQEMIPSAVSRQRLVACPLNVLVNISKIVDNQQWEVARCFMFSTIAAKCELEADVHARPLNY